jgi:hypothetical protein
MSGGFHRELREELPAGDRSTTPGESASLPTACSTVTSKEILNWLKTVPPRAVPIPAISEGVPSISAQRPAQFQVEKEALLRLVRQLRIYQKPIERFTLGAFIAVGGEEALLGAVERACISREQFHKATARVMSELSQADRQRQTLNNPRLTSLGRLAVALANVCKLARPYRQEFVEKEAQRLSQGIPPTSIGPTVFGGIHNLIQTNLRTAGIMGGSVGESPAVRNAVLDLAQAITVERETTYPSVEPQRERLMQIMGSDYPLSDGVEQVCQLFDPAASLTVRVSPTPRNTSWTQPELRVVLEDAQRSAARHNIVTLIERILSGSDDIYNEPIKFVCSEAPRLELKLR